MKIDFYTKLMLQIIGVFAVMIFASFIPDYLHSFFGDWYCGGSIGGCLESNQYHPHSPEWHWGYRHWLWFSMGIGVFAVQAIRIICFISDETV